MGSASASALGKELRVVAHLILPDIVFVREYVLNTVERGVGTIADLQLNLNKKVRVEAGSLPDASVDRFDAPNYQQHLRLQVSAPDFARPLHSPHRSASGAAGITRVIKAPRQRRERQRHDRTLKDRVCAHFILERRAHWERWTLVLYSWWAIDFLELTFLILPPDAVDVKDELQKHERFIRVELQLSS
ncbi:hypothetical protein DNTS_025772 [Danionella cerebrum]|uniref:Uncharacterized protein n=1 Tax=Danionella cerebrum TaxID=2873325 RepID=A0A553N4J3_9TELE|nr:hypothetical protein DNTS_025772 [Danionella translucida]